MGSIMVNVMKARRVLITGGSGLLGKYLLKTAPGEYDLYPTYNRHNIPSDTRTCPIHMRLESDDSVSDAFYTARPHIVIHAAGQNSVDVCERDFEQHYNVNVCGSYRVMQQCQEHDVDRLVVVSSNAVYRGDSAPYTEDDEMDPLNAYGWAKMLAEHVACHFVHDVLVVRPILMYGWPPDGARGNWATKVVASLRGGTPMRVVDDVVTQPLYAYDCAMAIWELLYRGKSGTYNIAGSTVCSLYEFAGAVARAFGLDIGMIQPAKLSDFSGLAPRPIDTSYLLVRMINAGLMPRLMSTGLRMMKEEETGE